MQNSSSQPLHPVLAGVRTGAWEWDPRTQKLVVSPATEALYGYLPGSGPFTLEDFARVVHPDDRAAFQHVFATATRARDLELEHRVIWPDGSYHWLVMSGRVVGRDSPRPERVLGVITEVTEAAQRRVAEILESIDEAFFALDYAGRFTYVNSRTEQLLEASAAELLGRHLQEALSGAPLLLLRKTYARVVRGGQSVAFEEHYAPRDAWLEVRAFPGADGVSVYVRDITERRHAEQDTRRLAAILECSEDAIVGKTLDGKVTSWNPAAERLYGYRAEEMLGQPISLIIPPDRSDELRTILKRLRNGERIERYETVRICKNGSSVDVALSISPIHDRTGRRIGAATIARDITERKRAEREVRGLNEVFESRVRERTAQLAKTIEQLQTVSEQLRLEGVAVEVASGHKSHFLAAMSHELRTPLNAIIGFAEVLIDRNSREVSEEQRDQFLRHIRRSGLDLLRLINDVLDLSKVEAGHMELDRRPVALGELIGDCVTTLGVLADSKHIVLQSACEPPGAVVVADPVRLKQVIRNLLSNPVKFTAAGGQVSITAHVSKRRALLRVCDSGIGIALGDQALIFEAFRQGTGRKGQEQGTGLGLALVRDLVELHGGRIRVVSTPGSGSCFSVSLPLPRPPKSFSRAARSAPAAVPLTTEARQLA